MALTRPCQVGKRYQRQRQNGSQITGECTGQTTETHQ